MLLWYIDLRLYVLGIIELVRMLLEHGVTGVRLHRFTQNALEGLFGEIRFKASGPVTSQTVQSALHLARFTLDNYQQLSFYNESGEQRKKGKRSTIVPPPSTAMDTASSSTG